MTNWVYKQKKGFGNLFNKYMLNKLDFVDS